MVFKHEWTLDEKYKDPRVVVKVTDRHGKVKDFSFPAYLFGLIAALKAKKNMKRHAVILVAGGVGNGKSTLVQQLAYLDSLFNDYQLGFNNVCWAMDKLVEKMDTDTNKNECIWADEFIQSGGSRGMAITNIGNKLKIGFVTKRLKRNTYFLVEDELQEFPEKVVSMCDAFINVKGIGQVLRGYWDCYANRQDIMFIYKAFKEYKKRWSSPEVTRILPSAYGTFDDCDDMFLDSKEFDRLKIEETRQADGDDKKKETRDSKREKKFRKHLGKTLEFLASEGRSYRDIEELTGVDRHEISEYIKGLQEVSA